MIFLATYLPGVLGMILLVVIAGALGMALWFIGLVWYLYKNKR